MQIQTPVPNLSSQLAEVIRLYFSIETDIKVSHCMDEHDGTCTHTAVAEKDGKTAEGNFTIFIVDDDIENKRRLQKAAKIAVYDALVNLTGKRQPWGCLTGVRPTKLYMDIDGSDRNAYMEFTEVYRVSEKKTLLCRDINNAQEEVDIPKNGFGLYIGIPFCTSRCSYCSFPGRIAKKGEMEAYIDALLMEMKSMAERLDIRKCFSIYIGGGTPTSLNEELFRRLMYSIGSLFGNVGEITLEAGRPDTITTEKLRAALDAKVNRVCVNPQSMVDETLQLIGRRHTADQLEQAYNLVRESGFRHINMDVIAGLPGETEREFSRTMQGLRRMRPESFTCHTLSIKHGSRINEVGPPETDGEQVAAMVDMASDCARDMGMRPYYLYRQKYMAGNLENTGYALPGYECKYNIANMGEQTSIMALGTGAISKVVDGDIINRYANPRDVFLYIQRVWENNGLLHKPLVY